MDFAILNWINQTFGNSKIVAILAKMMSILGSKWVILGIVILLLCFKKTRKVGFYVMIAGGAVWVCNDFILKNIVKRIRPFVAHTELANMCELAGSKLPDGYSMASGHSAVSMAVAVAIMCFSRKWGGVALACSIVIGLSRLVLCVHYPTDVLVGWILGAVLAVVLHFATNLALKIINEKWGKKNGKASNSNEKQA